MAINIGPKIPIMVSGAVGDPYLTQGNTLLRTLQPLLMANVISMALNDPPPTPNNGDTYIVAAAAINAWLGHETDIAYWSTDNPNAPSGEWEFQSPVSGWIVGNQADVTAYIFTGTVWASITSGLSSAKLYDGASSSPIAGDNHIACGTVSLAAGAGAVGTVTLTGFSVFSANTKYEVVAIPTLTGVANIFVTKTDGAHFNVTADVTTNPTIFLWIAVGRA